MRNRYANTHANWVATWRFLTIFPAPGPQKEAVPQLAMFPWVGLALGLIYSLTAWLLSSFNPAMAAFLLLALWLGSTGFLHVDGLADLVDGAGAAHGDKSRLLEVMGEPHVAPFAVVALVLLILGKFVALWVMLSAESWVALLLIPAWARLGAAWWASSLPPLTDGMAKWCQSTGSINAGVWLVIMLLLSLLLSPVLLVAPLVLWLWWWFLEARLQGMNGDCLGAGIEISELVLLLWVGMAL